MLSCPVRGRVYEDAHPDATTCPVTIRHTITGVVEVGECGMPLEPSPGDE